MGMARNWDQSGLKYKYRLTLLLNKDILENFILKMPRFDFKINIEV